MEISQIAAVWIVVIALGIAELTAPVTTADSTPLPSACPASPTVSTYISAFEHDVQESSVLKQAMNITGINAEEAAEMSYNVVYKLLLDMGNCNASRNARLLSESVNSTFGLLSSTSYPTVIGYELGNMLNNKGILTNKNAAKLANTFASEIVNLINASVLSPPESYIQGIMLGASCYLTSLGIPFYGDFLNAVYRYKEAVKCVTGQ